MAVVRPFKAVRPTSKLADKVAALPYDVMNSEEAREMVVGNPYSFLHVDKAEIDLEPSVDPYSPQVYEKARDNLYKMITDGIYIQDKSSNFYIYRQIMNGRAQTGLVGCTSIDDYLNDIIKKHEFTRPEKEQDRINHVDYTNANTGPIFLTYRAKADISEIINNWKISHDPVYDFTAEDGIQHTVWVIDSTDLVARIEKLFGEIDYLYIADGHHRSASAVKVGLKRREENPGYTGDEEFNFFLSVLFPDEELYIMDYNRVVSDLNGYSDREFMNLIRERFTIEEIDHTYRPETRTDFGMYLANQWYKLTIKDGLFDVNDPVDRLPVSILTNNLLRPILAIENQRTDSRIDFIGGIRGLQELEKRVHQGMRVAFSLHPTTIEDLMDIADNGEVMPPKSTWFEPKLRSGIFVHLLG